MDNLDNIAPSNDLSPESTGPAPTTPAQQTHGDDGHMSIRANRTHSVRVLTPDAQRVIATASHLLRAHLSKVFIITLIT
jgi:hypothetical protein